MYYRLCLFQWVIPLYDYIVKTNIIKPRDCMYFYTQSIDKTGHFPQFMSTAGTENFVCNNSNRLFIQGVVWYTPLLLSLQTKLPVHVISG